jgi:16S rRNA (cytosine967-C5)-methyltransferase
VTRRDDAPREGPARPRAPRSAPRRGGGAPRAHDDGGRARAQAILLAVDRGRYASELLDASDPPFVRELVLGTLRRRGTLDAVHDAYSRRRVEELDPPVRAAVRLGLYQYLFMDGIPSHAVAAETVRLLRGGGGEAAARRGYVNGVLRAVLRESRKLPEADDRGGASPTKRLHRPGRTVTFFSRPVFPDPARDRLGWLAAVHGHPRLLVERWVAQVGEEAAVARMEAGNAPAPLVLRPRAGRLLPEALCERLLKEGVACELLPRGARAPAVLVRPGRASALATRAFREGLFSVQDPEQMEAAETLAPRQGEVVWDACAAPGGKASQLAELLEVAGGGRVVATDAREERLLRLRENVARLGLGNVEVAAHDALADASPPGRPARGFDAVLLDAPCSNTAVLARRPEARWRLRADTFAWLATQQRRLLAACARHLAPHGRLVYAVCTHEPEEGAAHGLSPTASPCVWMAEAPELAALVARWTAAGELAAPEDSASGVAPDEEPAP